MMDDPDDGDDVEMSQTVHFDNEGLHHGDDEFDESNSPRELLGPGTANSSDGGSDAAKAHEKDDRDMGEYLQETLTELLFGSKMNMLMVFTPFAFVSAAANWSESVTFVFALLALCPFAERISFVTEDVAKYTNDTLGGLLNASFGNITELIVSVFALQAGLIRVVQVSMLGSILSNLLLVLGTAFLAGGIRNKEQSFNKTAAVGTLPPFTSPPSSDGLASWRSPSSSRLYVLCFMVSHTCHILTPSRSPTHGLTRWLGYQGTNLGLLVVAILTLALPATLSATHDGAGDTTPVLALNGTSVVMESVEGGDSPLWLSRLISIVMLGLYGLLIYFQLVTHTYIFEGQEDDEDEPPILGFWGGVFWLGVITIFISLLSDLIVDAIEGAARDLGVPILFLSAILVPIVGNAAEHAAAIIFAFRNKMEIALGIAVGSSVQIAVFVIPLCVIMGWFMGVPMSLDFHIFETICSVLTVLLVAVGLLICCHMPSPQPLFCSYRARGILWLCPCLSPCLLLGLTFPSFFLSSLPSPVPPPCSAIRLRSCSRTASPIGSKAPAL